MRAWIIEEQKPVDLNPLKYVEDYPMPEPGYREVLIKVKACGVCRTDAHIAEGDVPLHKKPIVPGHEVVGVVEKTGEGVKKFKPGDRIGVTWLNYACGKCKFCKEGKQNLCRDALFTGWDRDGCYAEYTVVHEDFGIKLPETREFVEMAPWMCPGTAGYRAFKLTGIKEGGKLGLYGFGPSATFVLQIAHTKGIEVFVITRSEKNRELARKYGADWVGGYGDKIPVKLDAGILFPPAGEIVPFALGQLDRGGTLVLAAITMTPIKIEDYNLIWLERKLTSLANVTVQDGIEFVELANRYGFKIDLEIYPFEKASLALKRVRKGQVRGNAVLEIE